MFKRRVLAMFLAMSLTLGSNSFAVLASELPAGAAPAQENQIELSGETEAISSGDAGAFGKSGIEAVGEEQADASALEETSEAADEEAAASEEESETEVPGIDTPAADTDNTDDPAASDEEPEETDGETDPEETLPEEELPAEEELPEEAFPEMIESFVDDAGIEVTYSLTAMDSYTFVVDESGVLTDIRNAGGSVVASLSGDIVLPEKGNDDRTITAIAENLFKDNHEITYVKLPSGVTSIGRSAFSGCSALKGIGLPNNLTRIEASAFEACSSLTKFVLPKKVETIGERAFFGDGKLYMINMKDADYSSLQSIGDRAFFECKALQYFCSDSSFFLPDSLETIGEYAFTGCKQITKLELPDSVTAIGQYAFQNCKALKSLVLSDRLTVIPKHAFEYCSVLSTIEFGDRIEVIDEYAFAECYNLGSADLKYAITKIANYAFHDCSKLVRVYIPVIAPVIETYAFDDVNASGYKLYLLSFRRSSAEVYATDKGGIYFTAIEDETSIATTYYLTSTMKTGDGSGTLIITTSKSDKKADPNQNNKGKGVSAGTKLFVYAAAASGSKLIETKCNGTPISIGSDGWGSVIMPKGGMLITAEFQNVSTNKAIAGMTVDMEISNGELKDNVLTLKVGQTARLFLLDPAAEDGSQLIPSAKISYTNSDSKIATIGTSSGTIKALKAGNTLIKASVTAPNGTTITKQLVVHVEGTSVDSIELKALSYDSNKVMLEADPYGQRALIDQTSVKGEPLSFTLKANVYDEEGDPTAVALKWTSSDSKVAALKNASTTTASTVNTITIPKGAYGESTITVTATNADKSTVSKKYVVRIRDYSPRLVSSSLTVNPKLENGAILEVIGAYGKEINPDELCLITTSSETLNSNFTCTYSPELSDSLTRRFIINPAYTGLKEKDYSLRVLAKLTTGTKYTLPLKIKVKSSVPSPKMELKKGQKKVNVFLKNDGTVIKPVITGLKSGVSVSRYELQAKSASEDDRLFLENFQIDPVTGDITQKATQLLYTSKKKIAANGYLVVYYSGYRDTVYKKFEIKIPLQTAAPSLKLNKTSDTFNLMTASETVYLSVLSGKTALDLREGGYHVNVLSGGAGTCVENCSIVDTEDDYGEDPANNGKIKLELADLVAGKIKLGIQNDNWSTTESGATRKITLEYQVKLDKKNPVTSLTASTVTLNKAFPLTEVHFGLKSNQYDTLLKDTQTFVVPSKTNPVQHNKLSVVYEGGIGTVSFADAASIKTGTYSFVCAVKDASDKKLNTVTLNVKVTGSVPTVTMSGSPTMNRIAYGQETAKIRIKASGVPAGYRLDTEATLASLRCTTKNKADRIDDFDWDIEDSKYLTVKMNGAHDLGTLNFSIRPVYQLWTEPEEGDPEVLNTVSAASAATFKITVKSEAVSVKMTAKGSLNLLDRRLASAKTDAKGKATPAKNSIVYTPELKNLNGSIAEVKVYDASGTQPKYDDPESAYFTAEIIDGKVYVTPKEDASIKNGATYPIMFWVKLNGYTYTSVRDNSGKMLSDIYKIKTAQTVPTVKANKSAFSVYLANRDYQATFKVTPKAGSFGDIESVEFDSKDTKALDTFNIDWEKNPDGTPVLQSDGSLNVKVNLKDTVAYKNGSTTEIKFYVRYKGQGTNTKGAAVKMKVTIKK